MTYPFVGEIKMTKVIKDGKEVIEWESVDMSKHAKGNLGIGYGEMNLDGVKWDASAPLVMGEPVERMRISMTDGIGITPRQAMAAVSFANHTEWAQVDKDNNVTHLDMDLCAKGPHNAYTALAIAIWNKAIEYAADNFEIEDDFYEDDVRESILRGKK